MNLIIDIGNSFIKVAIYENGEPIYFSSLKKVLVSDIKEIYKKFPFKTSIVSSVTRKNPYFISYLKKAHKVLVLSYKTKVPIKNLYKTPKTLGLDRLAGVVGAATLYPGRAALVIDIGTCMKFDYINKEGEYLGGNISPGAEMRLKAMHHFTSALPLIPRHHNDNPLGVSTKTAIQNGAIWGMKVEIEGFIKTLTKKMGQMVVILTGGDASYFGEMIDSVIFVHSNLLLKGLNEIIEHNS